MTTTTGTETEQRPGDLRQDTNRTAKKHHQKEAALMSNPTSTPHRFAPTGLTLADLEALAGHIGVKIENRQQLPGEKWGDYSHETRTIRLLERLAPVQRRDTLANLVAHARLNDISAHGSSGEEALAMAAQMVITRQDWETIGHVWEDCKETDPLRVFEQCGVMPSMAGAYAEVAEQWHPEGCIGWDGLCGRGDEDDIHSFAPVKIEISDATVRVSQSLGGTLGGEEPLDPGMGIEIDLPVVRDQMGSLHATPDQARQLAAFLVAQADRVDAWAAENADLFNGERQMVTAGGGEAL